MEEVEYRKNKGKGDELEKQMKVLQEAETMTDELEKAGFEDATINGKTLSYMVRAGATVEQLRQMTDTIRAIAKKNEEAVRIGANLIAATTPAMGLPTARAKNIEGFIKSLQAGTKLVPKMAREFHAFVMDTIQKIPIHAASRKRFNDLANMPNAAEMVKKKGFKYTLVNRWSPKNLVALADLEQMNKHFDELALGDKQKLVRELHNFLQKNGVEGGEQEEPPEGTPKAQKKRQELLVLHGRKLPGTWKAWLAHPERTGDKLSYVAEWIEKAGLPELELMEKKFGNVQTSYNYTEAMKLARAQGKPTPPQFTLDAFRDMGRQERYAYFDQIADFMKEYDEQMAASMRNRKQADVKESGKIKAEQEQTAVETERMERRQLETLKQELEQMADTHGITAAVQEQGV